MLSTYQNREKSKVIAIVVTLVVVVGLVVLIDRMNVSKSSTVATTAAASTQPTADPTPTTQDTSTSSSSASTSTSAYKDGTYTADAEYYVPHGYEDIKVTLTVQDGSVTGSDIVNSEGDHESVSYQEDFAEAYKSYVVGKKLDAISLSIISGASDTTDGFNDALAKIKQQAEA